MLIHKERLTGSTASAALTVTTQRFSGVMCRQLYVNPATATTTYNLSITDNDNDTIFSESGVQGRLIRALETPLVGVYTISITGASADESFTLFLALQEK